jgi:quinol-cytochrome oxidoreductase complex cytochrome b subunit
MHSTQKSQSNGPPPPETGLWGWLNRRTGLDTLLRTALYEPIPGGARLAYVFGSGLLFIFISQVITGVFLALYYVPSPTTPIQPSLTLRKQLPPVPFCAAFTPTVRAP